jgi:hypothetical protein
VQESVKAFVDPTYKMRKIKKVPLVAGTDTAGALGSFLPGVVCMITHVYLDVTTIASATCTVSCGTAANITTASQNLMDTVDVRTAIGSFDNIANAGTLGKALQRCSATQAVTFSTQSGASAGLVANAYVEYFEL